MARLESWRVTGGNDPYTAPELHTLHLQGLVYGHSMFDDGCPVLTTPIVSVSDERVVTKSGSVYELGAVDAMYEDQFPNARERLFSVLKGDKQ